MQYYYFLASLPMLSLDEPPKVTFETFLDGCRQHLRRRDWLALQDLLHPDEPDSGHESVRHWREARTCMRNAVARMRGARLKKDASPYLRHEDRMDVAAEKGAREAFSQQDPLARERALDRFRWAAIEELAGHDPFSIDALVAYGAKLRIAERWASFDKARGQERVDALVARRPGAAPRGDGNTPEPESHASN